MNLRKCINFKKEKGLGVWYSNSEKKINKSWLIPPIFHPLEPSNGQCQYKLMVLLCGKTEANYHKDNFLALSLMRISQLCSSWWKETVKRYRHLEQSLFSKAKHSEHSRERREGLLRQSAAPWIPCCGFERKHDYLGGEWHFHRGRSSFPPSNNDEPILP